MAPEAQAAFVVGDVVEIKGMPDSSGMNGTVGTLLKTIGKGRWVLKVEGEERTKVAMEENLAKFEKQAATEPNQKFCIVGTWDDWDPKEMKWNQEATCFEYSIKLGHDGAESFKILLNGDWDNCIYPDRKDACPHQAHQVKGPDDGGLDEEWTVGLHEADKASTGDSFTIKLFVSHDGKPKRVTWDKIESSVGQVAVKTTSMAQKVPMMREEPADEAKAPPLAPRQRWSSGAGAAAAPATRPAPVRPPPAPAPPAELDQPKMKGRWGGFAASELTGDQIVAGERAARERLARRFEEAAQLGMGMPMIQNGDEALEDPYKPERMQIMLAREEEERSGLVEQNVERYRRSVEESVRERAAQTPGTSRVAGPCAECSQATTNLYGQTFCCQPCLQAWQELREDGWDGSRLCGGLPAAQRAQQICTESKGMLSAMQSRRKVMRDYAPSFRLN